MKYLRTSKFLTAKTSSTIFSNREHGCFVELCAVVRQKSSGYLGDLVEVTAFWSWSVFFLKRTDRPIATHKSPNESKITESEGHHF